MNFIFIYCDNLGYGDLGCYGSTQHRTPNVDQMAREGVRFTDFYVTSGVCTPSRASLMTGCYAQRVDMHISDKGGAVLQPIAAKGLNPAEITLAAVLREQGYATACIGKWHLGDQPPFLPTRHGFDTYYGIPYSEDMIPKRNDTWPPLPLMRDDTVIEAPVDLTTVTERYTREALKFMAENRDRPFFLYLPQALPGSERFPTVGDAFRGKSANGVYGDSVEELDWSLGEILDALPKLGLEENTLVVFTSDNGSPRNHGGSNAPLAGWGYCTWEGGMRIPCVMRLPGVLPAGETCTELCSTLDILPTFARLAGTDSPQDRTIDGHDIWPLITCQEGARTPYEAYYFYHMEQLQAVRSGDWKLHLPLGEKKAHHQDERQRTELQLFNLRDDIGETTNVAAEHADVVKQLLEFAERAREDLGDRGRPGKGLRPAGAVDNPTPRVMG